MSDVVSAVPTPPAPTPPVVVGPLVKPWHASKTLIMNGLLLLAGIIGLIVQAAGIYNLNAGEVTSLGIAAAAINLALRLITNSAVEGTPAAQGQLTHHD